MGRPSKSDARDTRREILDAALDVFSQAGFAGGSMRQIAQAVGVRESALYHHFDSKEAILRALVDEFGPGRARALAQLDLDAELAHGLQPFLRERAQTLMGHWATVRESKWARLMFAEAQRGPAFGFDAPEVIGQAAGLLAAMFAELIRRKLVRSLDPEVLAREFMGPLILVRLQYLVLAAQPGRNVERVRRLVDQHVEFFSEAVGTPTTSTPPPSRKVRK